MSSIQASIPNKIQKVLNALGITHNYLGYYQAAYAIGLVLEDENRLLNVGKEIYQRIAGLDGCTFSAVERNLRTVSQRAWEINRKLLSEMAGYPLTRSPKPSEFIEHVATYLLRHPEEEL